MPDCNLFISSRRSVESSRVCDLYSGTLTACTDDNSRQKLFILFNTEMCKRNHKPVAKAMGWHRFWFPLQISISVSVSGCLKGFRFQVQGLFQIWAPSLTSLLDTHLNRVLHSISLYCMVLNCIQLHCMVLHGSPPSPTCWTPTSSRLSCTEALQCLGSCTNALQYMVS